MKVVRVWLSLLWALLKGLVISLPIAIGLSFPVAYVQLRYGIGAAWVAVGMILLLASFVFAWWAARDKPVH